LAKPLTPERLDSLEKASLVYLRHLTTGWEESSAKESERLKAVFSKTIDTTDKVVLQKPRPHLTLDSIVLDALSKRESNCEISVGDAALSAKITYLCGHGKKLNSFLNIISSSFTHEPKSLFHLTLEVLSRNYKRDDKELNILPEVLKDKVSYLPPPDPCEKKSFQEFNTHQEAKNAIRGHIRERESFQELWARSIQDIKNSMEKHIETNMLRGN